MIVIAKFAAVEIGFKDVKVHDAHFRPSCSAVSPPLASTDCESRQLKILPQPHSHTQDHIVDADVFKRVEAAAGLHHGFAFDRRLR